MELWQVHMVFKFEGNHNYYRQICSGADGFTCTTCGSIYKNKKGLRWHKRKQHGDDVCHFTFFVCRKCSISIVHIYYEDVEWKFFIIYILWYCMKGAGNESHEHTQMSHGLVVDNVEKDFDMNKDDDLVSILSQ